MESGGGDERARARESAARSGDVGRKRKRHTLAAAAFRDVALVRVVGLVEVISDR